MTEAEWLECTDPTPMLEFLTKPSRNRNLRLFGVACCRRFWRLLDDEHCKRLVEVGVPLGCDDLIGLPLDSCRKAIEMAERAADEAVPPDELHALSQAACSFQYAAEYYCACYGEALGPFDGELVASGTVANAAYKASLHNISPDDVVWDIGQAAGFLRQKRFGPADESGIAAERRFHCDLLRDIFGNPFQRVTFDPTWRKTAVVELAAAAYAERDFNEMPKLGNALKKAGCDNADILAHCREPSEHVRGCWVIDLVLGRE